MKFLTIFFLLWVSVICKSDLQVGPDPWNYESKQIQSKHDEGELPPDLRTPVEKQKQPETKLRFGEWWFKRLLTIFLKSGQVKSSDDGSVDISLQMRFDEDKWKVLDECLKSESIFNDEKFRRAVGYIEEAIYKPTISEQIVMAWSDYIQVYLIEYKMYITLMLSILGALGTLVWLWSHISHKHIVIILFALLYVYEVIISYKEAEQQEYEKFISAVNACKWYFWTSECTIPPPDVLIFMKHMNPLKIVIRMCTSFISEPMIAINATIRITIQGITDGLWFPFDKIVYGILITVINISLIYLLIIIVFNFIFNIPFNLNFLGIVSIGVEQNRRSLFSTNTNTHQTQLEDTDRISGQRLDRLLNVCSLALTNRQSPSNTNTNVPITNNNNIPKLKRSASTGRLPTNCSFGSNCDIQAIKGDLRKRPNFGRGEGDH